MTQPYLSLLQADSYFAARSVGSWAEAEAAERSAALLRASDWLDQLFLWAGQPASPDQARAFPRLGLAAAGPDSEQASTPQPVLDAVCDLALALLEGEREAEQLLGIGPQVRREQVGAIQISYDAAARRGAGRLTRQLARYLAGPSQTRITRS